MIFDPCFCIDFITKTNTETNLVSLRSHNLQSLFLTNGDKMNCEKFYITSQHKSQGDWSSRVTIT